MTYTTLKGNRIKIEKGEMQPDAPEENEIIQKYFPNIKLIQDDPQ